MGFLRFEETSFLDLGIKPTSLIVQVTVKSKKTCDVCGKVIKYGHYNCQNPNRDAWTAIVYLDTPAHNGEPMGNILRCHRLSPQQIIERREFISGVIKRLRLQGRSFSDALRVVTDIVDLV